MSSTWASGRALLGGRGQQGGHAPGRVLGHDPDQAPDFGVSWNDQLDKGGVVVSDEVFVSLDVEAILAEDLAQARKNLGLGQAKKKEVALDTDRS